jgi:hypothetical protein
MMYRPYRALLLAAAFAASGSLITTAHEAKKGPNGGAVIDVEGHHVEMVATPAEITFFLTDEKDAPVPAAGAEATAILQSGDKMANLELAIAEPNKLVGKLEAPLAAGSKIVISGTLADGHGLQGRFELP